MILLNCHLFGHNKSQHLRIYKIWLSSMMPEEQICCVYFLNIRLIFPKNRSLCSVQEIVQSCGNKGWHFIMIPWGTSVCKVLFFYRVHVYSWTREKLLAHLTLTDGYIGALQQECLPAGLELDEAVKYFTLDLIEI